jgi:hypothetical protein
MQGTLTLGPVFWFRFRGVFVAVFRKFCEQFSGMFCEVVLKWFYGQFFAGDFESSFAYCFKVTPFLMQFWGSLEGIFVVGFLGISAAGFCGPRNQKSWSYLLPIDSKER